MKYMASYLGKGFSVGAMIMALFTTLLVANANANTSDPKAVVEDRYNAFLQLIDSKTLVAGMDEQKLYELMEKELDPVVDFSRIARKVMGKFSRQATDEQIETFTKSFKHTLVNTYSKGLENIDKLKTVDIDNAVIDDKGKRAKVNSIIHLSTGERYQVVYSLYLAQDGHWKVENLVVEGVNIGIVFRNQFAQYMEQHGNIQAAIDNWGK